MARTLNTPVFFTVQVLLCQIASSGANCFSADNFGTVLYQQGINGDSTERGRLPLVYSFPEPTFYPGVTSGTLPINAHNDLVGFSGLGDIVMARTLNTPVFFTVQVLLCQIASSGANSFSADNFGTVSYQQGINGDSTERGRLPLVYSFPEPTFYPGVTSGTLPINAHNDLVGFSGLGDIVMARTLNTPVFFTVQMMKTPSYLHHNPRTPLAESQAHRQQYKRPHFLKTTRKTKAIREPSKKLELFGWRRTLRHLTFRLSATSVH
ncbi:uncharacterized protein ISCGN_022470 [Ixodes scapularis]